MKINKKSWHYKFLYKINTGFDMPKTLCSYFWMLVANLGLAIALVGFMAWLLFIVAAPIVHLFFPSIADDKMSNMGLIIDSFTVLFILVIYICVYISKSKNIFIQYLKAKKEKVCPLIEYVEEK